MLFGAPGLDDNVSALHVADLTQPLAKGLRQRGLDGKRREISDPVNLSGLLALSNKGRKNESSWALAHPRHMKMG